MKIINEEIEETNAKITSFKFQLKEEKTKFDHLEVSRDKLKRNWKQDRGMKELHIEVLNLMMKESIQVVENLNQETKFTKAEVRLKLKDVQIEKLQEQINLRDSMLTEAKIVMQGNDISQSAL